MKLNRILPLFLAVTLLTGFTGINARDVRTERQEQAHQIAELARSMGLDETDPIIVRAQEIWWEEENKDKIDFYNGIIESYNEDTEESAIMLAKLVFSEARGIESQTEQACVIWSVLNRVDSEVWPDTIYGVLTQPYQFAYRSYSNTVDDYGRDLVQLARDVLYRYDAEKSGEENVGRVLPKDYTFYIGDGIHNYFRNPYGHIYDGSLESPYST